MKLNYKRTILAGLAFMSISGFWGMYDAVTPLILKDSFHLSEVLNGVVMAMDNVFALILLPVFGIWSDRTNTKFGKRMPFIAIGTMLAVIAMFFMPYADNQRNLVMFLIATGSVLLSMSFYRSPAVALMPDITPREPRRRRNTRLHASFLIDDGIYGIKYGCPCSYCSRIQMVKGSKRKRRRRSSRRKQECGKEDLERKEEKSYIYPSFRIFMVYVIQRSKLRFLEILDTCSRT